MNQLIYFLELAIQIFTWEYGRLEYSIEVLPSYKLSEQTYHCDSFLNKQVYELLELTCTILVIMTFYRGQWLFTRMNTTTIYDKC